MEIEKPKTSDAQKKATKKYRENNKDKVNQQRKLYYQNRKAKDPNYLLYKRQKAKEYYQKKKNLKVLEEIKEDFKTAEPIEIIEEVKEEPKPLIIEHPVLDETKPEKKKRKYNKITK